MDEAFIFNQDWKENKWYLNKNEKNVDDFETKIHDPFMIIPDNQMISQLKNNSILNDEFVTIDCIWNSMTLSFNYLSIILSISFLFLIQQSREA